MNLKDTVNYILFILVLMVIVFISEAIAGFVGRYLLININVIRFICLICLSYLTYEVAKAIHKKLIANKRNINK